MNCVTLVTDVGPDEHEPSVVGVVSLDEALLP